MLNENFAQLHQLRYVNKLFKSIVVTIHKIVYMYNPFLVSVSFLLSFLLSLFKCNVFFIFLHTLPPTLDQVISHFYCPVRML